MPVYSGGPVTSNTNAMGNTTSAVPETKYNPANVPVPNYTTKPAYNPNYTMPAAAPTYPPSIKLKTNTSYETQPSNGHHPQQASVVQSIVAEPQAPVEQAQTEHDTTHDELDFETGFDLEGVFVNDSQDDHPIDGLNTSSYFSLS